MKILQKFKVVKSYQYFISSRLSFCIYYDLYSPLKKDVAKVVNIRLAWKSPRDKHSSLFRLSVGDKKCLIDKWCYEFVLL